MYETGHIYLLASHDVLDLIVTRISRGGSALIRPRGHLLYMQRL